MSILRALRLPLIGLLLALLLPAAAQDRLFLYGGGSFAEGEPVAFSAYLGAQPSAQLTLYRVGNPERVLEMGGPPDFAATDELDLEVVNRQRLERAGEDDYRAEVEFRGLSRGLYLAQLESAAATMALVTDVGLVVKTDEDTALSYTVDLDSGEPRRANIILFRGDRLYAEGLANEQGLTEFDIEQSEDQSLAVAARYGDSWAFSAAWWSRWSVERYRLYLHTDRPVYRPGHTVYFKGTARRAGTLEPLNGHEVEVIVRDADGSEIHREPYRSDEFGSFHGELNLPEVPPLGSYSLEANVDGEGFYSSFQVQEYVRPEYRVEVDPDVAGAVQGDSVTVDVGAEYYFGGPVAGASVDYALIRQPYERFRYRSAYGFYEEADFSYGGELIERGEGVLDENGLLELELELPEFDDDYRLLVQAGVADEAQREITGSGSLVAYRADLVLGVSTNRYAYQTGEAATVNVQAEDIDGEPARVPFKIEIEQVAWTEDGEEVTTDWGTLEGSTGADGTGTLQTDFAEQGSYRLTVSASDEAGRLTSDSDTVWVYGGSPRRASYGSLEVEADKPEYQAGEMARFVIRSPVPDVPVLVSHEGQQLEDYELHRLSGSSLTLELPIESGMAPNGYLSAVVVGGGEIYTGLTGYRVLPEDGFLNVEITSDSDVYRPGETGEFRLRVSDSSGEGVRAQLTLALVDEATLAIAPDWTEDVRAYFHGLYPNAVSTDVSSASYFGNVRPLGAEGALPPAMDEAVFGQGKAGFAEAELREDFRDTALWLPDLETGPDGIASFTAQFPDNLSEWRLTARAITLGQAVGQQTYNATTTLPVIARLSAPRFLVDGDEATLGVIGQNNLPSDLLARFELDTGTGLSDARPPSQERPLASGESARADFDVTANERGDSTLTASVLTAQESDSLRLPLPVLPHGVIETISWAGGAGDSWEFVLSAGEDPALVSGELFLTPSLAAAVSPALGYLAGFPYGCTEQTMSRFLPSLLASRAGSAVELPHEVELRLDEYVTAGLRQLYEFQHGDGGWGFWQYDISDPFITAYVVTGLLEAQASGYNVRSWVLERGLDYLEMAVDKDGYQTLEGTDARLRRIAEADAKAYSYLALARAGRNIDRLAQVAAARDLSPYGLALTVLAFEVANRDVEANLYLDELMSDIVERESVAYWNTRAPRFAWSDDRVETTARALEALARLRHTDPLVPKIVNWLLLERRGAAWVSTKDTAAVVEAALALEESSANGANGTSTDVGAESIPEVRLDGEVLNGEVLAGREQAGSQTVGGSVRFELTGLEPGPHTLEVGDAEGRLYAGASLDYLVEREEIESQDDGVRVSRSYRSLDLRRQEDGRLVYDPVPLRDVAVGDYVLATVELRPGEDLRYLLVNEPLPAGFQVIENDMAFPISQRDTRYGDDYLGWNYWFDGREVRDQRIDFYFSRLSEPVTFHYLLRAQTPGEFTALPTRAWLMYSPDVGGHGSQDRLRVAGDEQR